MEIKEVVEQSRASQNKIELAKVLHYVSEIKPLKIVEVGVHRGYSLEVWDKAFPEAHILGIQDNISEIDHDVLNDNVSLIQGDSHKQETLNELLIQLNGKPIDFLFIDGDHTYEGVKKDYEMYSPLVRSGGIIGFHDIMLNSNEYRMAGVDVQRYWNEVIGKGIGKELVFWDEIGKGTGTGLYYKK